MTVALRSMLEKLAARGCWGDDDDDFMVDDYAGGNIDDAYNKGVEDGATHLARELLELISDT